MCYTEKGPNAWHCQGRQKFNKTRNKYSQPRWHIYGTYMDMASKLFTFTFTLHIHKHSNPALTPLNHAYLTDKLDVCRRLVAHLQSQGSRSLVHVGPVGYVLCWPDAVEVRAGLLCLWLLCGFNLTYINM